MDAPWLVELDADPEVRRFTGGGAAPTEAEIRSGPLARILAWHDRSVDLGYWWIHDRETDGVGAGPPLGWVHVRPVIWADDPLSADPRQAALELGWRLHRRAWGRGVATETAAALADDAIGRLGATRLAAVALPDNDASFRVMERLGLRYAGVRLLHGGERCVEYGRDAADPPGTEPARVWLRELGVASADQPALRAMLVHAFGGGGEADLVRSLLHVGRSVVVLVAEDPGSGEILGMAALSPAAAPASVACLGPVAVRSDARSRGIGSRLVRAALTWAAGQGFSASAVLGDPAWYARFGFEPASPRGYTCRWTADDAFMVRALEGGQLPPPGIINWDPRFEALEP